ncbi:MAG: hypothetical protein ACT4NV_14220 [Rhodoferax sp.]
MLPTINSEKAVPILQASRRCWEGRVGENEALPLAQELTAGFSEREFRHTIAMLLNDISRFGRTEPSPRNPTRTCACADGDTVAGQSTEERGAQHTPGPWVWDGYSLRPANPDSANYAVHTIIEAEHIGWGFAVADRAATRAESDANQALIAAAPDLIDATLAAEAVLAKGRWIKGSTDPESVALWKLRAAIAKATGGAA